MKLTIDKVLSEKLRLSLLILVSFSLLITTACKNSSAIQESSNESQNLQSAEIQNPIKSESLLEDETIEKDSVVLFTEKQSPVRIIDAISISGKPDFKKGAKVEIQNNSNKAISSVSLGFAPPVLCIKYMMIGDRIINDDEINKTNKMQVGEKHFMNVPADFAEDYFSLQSFKDCPRDHRKPMVYISEVQFEDGGKWNANELEQK